MFNKNKGFTLIELLVVISIIGLLSSIVLTSLNDARAKARDAQRISELGSLKTALNLYYEDNNEQYPPHTPVSSFWCNNNNAYFGCYTNIIGNSTEAVFKLAVTPFIKTLPEPGLFANPNKNNVTSSRIMYRRLTNNTISGCSNTAQNCFALVIYPEANTSWGNIGVITYFVSNGEIRQGFDNTLY